MIDLRHLRHALAVAEHGNFARAADAVHITQSAMTRSIQSLESALGVTLFDRSRNGVEPTDVGRIVLRHALTLDTTSRDLEREVRLAQGLESGELVIGTGLYGGLALIEPAVARLNQLHPKLRVHVHVAPWNLLPVRARARETDIIVAESGIIHGQSDFESVTLSEHRAIVTCRPGHPLLTDRPGALADLFRFPLVGPPLSTATIDRLCAEAPDSLRAAIKDGNMLTTQCDSAAFLKNIVMDTDALAVMYPFMIRRELRSGQLVALPGMDTGISARFAVAWIAGRTVSAATRTFIDLLRDWDENAD